MAFSEFFIGDVPVRCYNARASELDDYAPGDAYALRQVMAKLSSMVQNTRKEEPQVSNAVTQMRFAAQEAVLDDDGQGLVIPIHISNVIGAEHAVKAYNAAHSQVAKKQFDIMGAGGFLMELGQFGYGLYSEIKKAKDN